MTNQEKLEDPSLHLLIMVLGKIIRKHLGGTEERSEELAIKLIKIMDDKI